MPTEVFMGRPRLAARVRVSSIPAVRPPGAALFTNWLPRAEAGRKPCFTASSVAWVQPRTQPVESLLTSLAYCLAQVHKVATGVGLSSEWSKPRRAGNKMFSTDFSMFQTDGVWLAIWRTGRIAIYLERQPAEEARAPLVE